MPPDDRPPPYRTKWRDLGVYLLVWLLASGLLVSLSGLLEVHQREEDRRGWEARLESSASGRASLIELWLHERHADSRVVADSAARLSVLAVDRGDEQRLLTALLDRVVREYGYVRALLLRQDGSEWASSSAAIADPAWLTTEARSRLAAGQDVVGLTRNAGGHLEIAFLARVGDPDRDPARHGVVVLVQGAAESLFPLIRQSFGSLPTEEVVLARREGAEVIYLTPPRELPGVIEFRLPVDLPRLAAARALEGGATVGDFVDYQKRPVLAATRRLALTDWGLVCKVDLDEVLAEFRSWRRMLLALTAALCLLLGGALVTHWQQGSRAALLREVEAQRLSLQVQQSIAASEARYRRLVEDMDAVIWDSDAQVDANGDFVCHFVSRRIVDLLGVTAEDWVARPALWRECLHPDDRTAACAGRRAAAEGAERRLRYRLLARDGREVWVLELLRKVPGAAGEPARIQGVLFDESQPRRIEEQLRQAQKLEAIGRLAGGVAHDFNNLMTVVIGFSEMALQDAADNAALRGNLEEIRKAGLRAAEVTRQLLAYSRRQVLRPVLLDLAAVLTDLARMLGHVIGEKIALDLQILPGVRQIRADRGQIEQAVLNLAVNARDAMPEGGQLILRAEHLFLEQEMVQRPETIPPGTYEVLTVADQGSGMNEEVLGHLFEPFFTTKPVGKGTGLGLASVYGAVKQSEGYVSVESLPGRGANFRLYFPSVSVETPATERAPTHSPQGTGTVLLVEDEAEVCRVTTALLTRFGYRVLTAATGEDALVVAREQQPGIDVLVTDVVMPGMGGVELAERLRAAAPTLPVVFLTGYADQELPAGAIVLEKPYSPADLAKILARLRAPGPNTAMRRARQQPPIV